MKIAVCHFSVLGFLYCLVPTHGVLEPYNFNFSCPKDPTAVLLSYFHRGSNAVGIALFSREIDTGLSLKIKAG